MFEGTMKKYTECAVEKKHKSGWNIWTFSFVVTGTSDKPTWFKVGDTGTVNACDIEHAEKQIKKWAKKEGFTYKLVD